jgi:hypothetical protein
MTILNGGVARHDPRKAVVPEGSLTGRYRLRNTYTGKFLDNVIVQNNPDGCQVYGWQFNGQANQVWIAEPVSHGNYRFKNLFAGKYLDTQSQEVTLSNRPAIGTR